MKLLPLGVYQHLSLSLWMLWLTTLRTRSILKYLCHICTNVACVDYKLYFFDVNRKAWQPSISIIVCYVAWAWLFQACSTCYYGHLRMWFSSTWRSTTSASSHWRWRSYPQVYIAVLLEETPLCVYHDVLSKFRFSLIKFFRVWWVSPV